MVRLALHGSETTLDEEDLVWSEFRLLLWQCGKSGATHPVGHVLLLVLVGKVEGELGVVDARKVEENTGTLHASNSAPLVGRSSAGLPPKRRTSQTLIGFLPSRLSTRAGIRPLGLICRRRHHCQLRPRLPVHFPEAHLEEVRFLHLRVGERDTLPGVPRDRPDSLELLERDVGLVSALE